MNKQNQVLPYHNQTGSKKEQVSQMFNAIACSYDFLNRFLSLGIDKYWRRRAIKMVKKQHPKKILDIATGTGEFAIEAAKLNPKQIVGIDISEGMLKLGRKKIKKKKLENVIELKIGDVEKLNFEDNTFDAVIAGFGVRNFQQLAISLKQMHRVCQPGAMLVILEFSKPVAFPVKQLYQFYFYKILPIVGRNISKDKSAYRYLPESVNAFPDGKEFLKLLSQAGFINPTQKRLTFGVVTIYSATK